MRKMFLSALACVAFAGSAFASNEIVVEKQSETTIEYKVVTSEGGPLLDVMSVKCYYRICVTSSRGVRSCTDWLEVDCSKTADDATLQTEKKLVPGDKGGTA